MKKYHDFDKNGIPISVYSKDQSHIDGLVYIEEAPGNHYKYVSGEWVENPIPYGVEKIEEMETYILKKLLRWPKALTAIQAQFNNVFIAQVESAGSFAEIDTAYDLMLGWLTE